MQGKGFEHNFAGEIKKVQIGIQAPIYRYKNKTNIFRIFNFIYGLSNRFILKKNNADNYY